MTAPAIAPAELTPAQELYRLEKAKRSTRVNPALEAAAVELRRQDDARTAAKKGGRPRGPTLSLGRRRLQFDTSDAPGRSEFLALDRPFHPQPPRAETPMPAPKSGTWNKICQRSGVAFEATGPAAKYCGTCDECTAAGAGSSPKMKAPKKEKPARKAKRASTGYRSELPRRTAQRAAPPQHDPDSLYARRLMEIDHELKQLAPLVVERDALLQLIETVATPAPNGNGRKTVRAGK